MIRSLEQLFASLPLPLLEVWGRFGYLLGLALMLCAYLGFTLRPGGQWALGRLRQGWDGQALISCALTFVLIFFTGWLGSHIVLVPGAQTFESLKDLSVFLCVVLFGYPALVTVPFAYGLSDLIEGVPPEFLLDWLPGYFINPACFWIAHQLIGKNPDFRLPRTWAWYLLFVALFMAIEPQLWGYICAGKFTPEISYRSITPALVFTTGITWLLAPWAMLLALPLARRHGLFWAEIPGHASERRLGRADWLWHSGSTAEAGGGQGLPIRVALAAPLIGLVLLMVGSAAYQALSSAEAGADKLAGRLHQEIAENINLQLDDYLERHAAKPASEQARDIGELLQRLPVALHGRAFVLSRSGQLLAASTAPADANDPVLRSALL
nr:hypothetical protein [uncultured Roseateles sp.]